MQTLFFSMNSKQECGLIKQSKHTDEKIKNDKKTEGNETNLNEISRLKK